MRTVPEVFHSYLKNHFIFSKLTNEQVSFIYPFIRFKLFGKGDQIIFEENSVYLYLILNGKIKLVDSGNPEMFLIKDILYSGEFFGDVYLMGKAQDHEFAEVLANNTIVCYCPVQAIREMILLYPDLALQFATYAGVQLRRLQKRYLTLAGRDAELKLIYFIKRWANAEGIKKDGKIFVNRFLTLGEIAEYIFTSRQTVHTLFTKFKKKGYVQWNKKQFMIDPMLWKEMKNGKERQMNQAGL